MHLLSDSHACIGSPPIGTVGNRQCVGTLQHMVAAYVVSHQTRQNSCVFLCLLPHAGDVVRAPCGVMHGKTSPVFHTNVGLLEGLPK